jgi:hypothetical protein
VKVGGGSGFRAVGSLPGEGFDGGGGGCGQSGAITLGLQPNKPFAPDLLTRRFLTTHCLRNQFYLKFILPNRKRVKRSVGRRI